jgi:hypothetical protein
MSMGKITSARHFETELETAKIVGKKRKDCDGRVIVVIWYYNY